MKGRLFLFQWHKESAEQRANKLREEGWEVEVEWEDGARGGKKVKIDPPDLIVMDLSHKPSHSRETADGLRSLKATRHLPIIFVDGTEETIAKTKAKVADAIYTTSSELSGILDTFSTPDSTA